MSSCSGRGILPHIISSGLNHATWPTPDTICPLSTSHTSTVVFCTSFHVLINPRFFFFRPFRPLIGCLPSDPWCSTTTTTTMRFTVWDDNISIDSCVSCPTNPTWLTAHRLSRHLCRRQAGHRMGFVQVQHIYLKIILRHTLLFLSHLSRFHLQVATRSIPARKRSTPSLNLWCHQTHDEKEKPKSFDKFKL